MPHANGATGALPPIAALFLVVFDQKVGYKIAWQKTLSGLKLEGVVEYKSLPSGLHNVKQDLIYFTQDEYAGLSAFVSKAAGAADRNAHFAAVGVYVPLSYGRLGRAWMHARSLRELAEACVDKLDDNGMLEKYWQKHKLDSATDALRTSALEEPSSPIALKAPASKVNKRANQALTDAAGFSVKEHVLSPDHPALSMPGFLDAFGPLIFPLHRAALLRKRIMFLGNAPVQRACNYVYDLSIFSNVPPSLNDIVDPESPLNRIRPLFNVGVHDITELKTAAQGDQSGWIACTTDDILGTKHDLYDILVEIPESASGDQWPKITTSQGTRVLATQRDLRRYNALRKELARMDRINAQHRESEEQPFTDDPTGDEDESRPMMRSVTSLSPDLQHAAQPSVDGEALITEPASWTSIAYSSFLWWASAGERSTAEQEEAEQDASLLEDLVTTTSVPSTPVTPTSRPRSSSFKRKKRFSSTSLSRLVSGQDSDDEDREPPSVAEVQQKAMLLIAYFHRCTALLISGMADIIDAALEEADDNDSDEPSSQLSAEDVARLGLDVWSEADAKFVTDLSWLWFEREMRWHGRGVELCGVRIC